VHKPTKKPSVKPFRNSSPACGRKGNRMRELLKVLSLGNQVEDPAKWKRRQLLLTLLTASLTALFNILEYYGIEVPFEVSSEVINNISLGILAVGNGILTLATSTKVGPQAPAVKPSP
jgi:hypothetical protein